MKNQARLLLIITFIIFLIPAHNITWWIIVANRNPDQASRVAEFHSIYPLFLQNATLLTSINIIAGILLVFVGSRLRAVGRQNIAYERIGLLAIIMGALIAFWMIFTLM